MVDPPWLVLWKIEVSIIVRPYHISWSMKLDTPMRLFFLLPNHSHDLCLLDLSRSVSYYVLCFLGSLLGQQVVFYFEYFLLHSLWLTHHYLVDPKDFKKLVAGFTKNLINLAFCHPLIGIPPFIILGDILLSHSLISIWDILLFDDEWIWKHHDHLFLLLMTIKALLLFP